MVCIPGNGYMRVSGGKKGEDNLVTVIVTPRRTIVNRYLRNFIVSYLPTYVM